MRKLLSLACAFLAACGSGGGEVALTVSGVAMADLAAIQAELGGIPGVSEVRPGALKDGSAEFKLRYAGEGAALAAELAKRGRTVTGFDTASVRAAWDAKAAPPAAVEAAKPALPAKAEEKEVKVAIEKDPLKYKVHQLEQGTIATFEGWKINHIPNNDLLILETHPEGKENDFQMLILLGTQGEREQAKLFEEGPVKLKQVFPGLRESGEAKKATFGGDEARLQDWTIDIQGRGMKVQTILLRKKDVAIALLAVFTDESYKEYGRALGITAQSISVKESPPDPGLVGTWALEKYYSSGAGTSNAFSHSSSTSLTIYPNGTFTERSFSSSNLNNSSGTTSAYLDGGDRGKVVRRGSSLTFHYDNGKTWNTDYRFDGGALFLGKNMWLKQ